MFIRIIYEKTVACLCGWDYSRCLGLLLNNSDDVRDLVMKRFITYGLYISHPLPVRCWCSRELRTFENSTWKRYVSILLQGMFGSVDQAWDFLCRRFSSGEDERSGRCPVSDPPGSAGGGRAARDSSWHHCAGLPSDSTRHWGHTSFAVPLKSSSVWKKQLFIPAGLIFISTYS